MLQYTLSVFISMWKFMKCDKAFRKYKNSTFLPVYYKSVVLLIFELKANEPRMFQLKG